MKVLLTGATGFLGRRVLESLQRKRIDVVAIGRRAPGGVPFIEADLLQVARLEPLLHEAKATHLLHLAWFAVHGEYWTSALNLRWVEATIRLVEAFCDTGGRGVVAAGTCAEYDWAHGFCREESTPLRPATLYGTAKDATRRLVAAVCLQRGIRCAWGRVFFPYGPGEDGARLIPRLRDALTGKVPAFGVNAGAYRDFLHAEDVAEAFATLLQSDAEGAYNISSGEPLRLDALVRLVAQAVGGDADAILQLPSARPGEPHMVVGDNAKLRALGWRPAVALADGLAAVARG